MWMLPNGTEVHTTSDQSINLIVVFAHRIKGSAMIITEVMETLELSDLTQVGVTVVLLRLF